MKFSELSTGRALDVMCELTPYIDNIISDIDIVNAIGKVVSPDEPLNKYGNFVLVAGRISECVPLLLRTHRDDVYGILSVMSERPAEEISEQKFTETIRQVQELIQDEDFISFFKSSAQQGQSERSVPSVISLG